MNTIKILHLSKIKGISGSENHLLTLLSELNKQQFDVYFGILAEPRHLKFLQDYKKSLSKAGVTVFTLEMHKYLDLRLLWTLKKYMVQEKFHLVHTHLIHADCYGTLAAKMAGVPLIISSRHNDDRFRRYRAIIWLNRLLARWHSKIIVISDWVGRFLQEVEGIPADKIVRIHYGLDPTPIEALSDPAYIRLQFHIPDGAPVIGTVGRLTAQKGQTYLLQAARLLKNDFPHLRVVIIGDGELRQQLEQQTKTLDIADNIIFTGVRPYQETMRLLSGMEFFVFPSLWEGFGLVLLEAMALKKAIVASDVSAIPESVVDGNTGMLAPPGQVEPLVEALRCLLKNPRRTRQMGIAGFHRLQEEFSIKKMVCATANLYEQLAGCIA
ncbi:glycosyl transferase group 1 [Candidatus Vecturithrix granuli]|uniref:Glycosyl transferase group 1 n=1 Tax=Vecturithrix granuli TaxID=1499967 RepID=A0A081BZZ0_VECG1|nr:glycosyl transferase group 1 [Candidatus Vecturithrix granuli]